MTTYIDTERSEATEVEATWDLPSIRTVVAEAAERGFRLGVREPGLARAAASGAIARGAVPDEHFEQLEAMLESLGAATEVRFANAWDEGVAFQMELALEKAIVLGLGEAAAQSTAGMSAGPVELGTQGLDAVIDDVVAQLVDGLAVSRRPVPGAQKFVDRLRGETETTRVFTMPRSSAKEVRTDWIRDHDTGRPYQWSIVREGTRLAIGRRRRGEGAVTRELSVRVAEAEVLRLMLAQAVEGWDGGRTPAT